MPQVWTELRDCDTETLLVQQVGERVWRYLEVMDLWEASGEREGEHYAAEVAEVDLAQLPAEELARARSFVGMGPEDETDAALAEACREYGLKAILWSDSGNARRPLYRAARAAALATPHGSEAHESARDRPVNALGSTAREYARGDINAAVSRGLAAGDDRARIIAQMQAPLGSAQVVRVDTSAIPSDDPLAFLAGYSDGFGGAPLPEVEPGEELAEAYHAGREWGADVRTGRKSRPEWVQG